MTLKLYGFVASILVCAAPVWADFEAPARPDIASAFAAQSHFKIRTFIGHDTNIPFLNDHVLATNPDPAGLLYGVTLEGGFSQTSASGWHLGGVVRADLVNYEGDGFVDDYDQTTLSFTGVARREFQSGNVPGVFTTTLGLRRESTRNVAGVGGFFATLSGDVTLDPAGPLSWGATATISSEDFDSTWVANPSGARDGTFTSLIGHLGWDVNAGPLYEVVARAGLQRYNADGPDYSYDGYLVGLDTKWAFAPRLSGQLGVTYTDRDYDGDFTAIPWFTAPGRENQQVTTINGRLIYQLARNRAVDFSLRYEQARSNSSQFEGDRTVAAIGYTVVWP